jgi:hypothetical protein
MVPGRGVRPATNVSRFIITVVPALDHSRRPAVGAGARLTQVPLPWRLSSHSSPRNRS